jgi:hypothetical protein
MKWRSARSPNGTSAICTPGGYQRDKIGKLGPLEMRRRSDSRQDVGRQRQMQHLLLDHADHRSFPGLDPHKLGRRQALVSGAFERELRVQVLTHQAVLDFTRLTQQVHQLLAGIHLQRRLSRKITRHVRRHRYRLTPRMPLRAFQDEAGADPGDPVPSLRRT